MEQDRKFLRFFTETFMQALQALEEWKLQNDNYDDLNVSIRKDMNIYQYTIDIFWSPCEEIE